MFCLTSCNVLYDVYATDVDGLGSHEIGGQLMYEFRSAEGVMTCEETPEMKLKIEAGNDALQP